MKTGEFPPMKGPIEPTQLRLAYRSFLSGTSRILLTGHSHQAWPDVARDGLLEAFSDAARHVDDKWERAFAVADALRGTIATRIGGRAEDIALGPNIHELCVRALSSIPDRSRRHIVTTNGEFHSLRRQLGRLAEEGIEVKAVPTSPVETLGERLAAAVRPDTCALMASYVLFETAAVVPNLRAAIEAAHRVRALVLIDAYHAFNALPFSIASLGPDPLFVVGGGYKYAQWGEGCCFMRVPPDCEARPVITGWFSDFASLEHSGGAIEYGARGCDRFAGSTYDPTSHYRAQAVNRFFDEHGLTVQRLRALSLEQTSFVIDALRDFDIRTPEPAEARGGFVSVATRNAGAKCKALREEGVWTDARGELLRIGPAPYVTFDELDRAVATIARIIR